MNIKKRDFNESSFVPIGDNNYWFYGKFLSVQRKEIYVLIDFPSLSLLTNVTYLSSPQNRTLDFYSNYTNALCLFPTHPSLPFNYFFSF